jgi:hypothetical protein
MGRNFLKLLRVAWAIYDFYYVLKNILLGVLLIPRLLPSVEHASYGPAPKRPRSENSAVQKSSEGKTVCDSQADSR